MHLPEHFSAASINDVAELNVLVNSAYRGDSSRRGWTTEADLLDGIRTDEAGLAVMINKQDAVILLYRPNKTIDACVYLEKQGVELYLGMLTVSPQLQTGGIGKKIMAVAEQYAQSLACKAVVMTVISARHELINWYQKRGYTITGEKKPFPNDPRFGIPKQPLEFIVMRKELN